MQRVCGQRIIGHAEKGIIPGAWLGSSAANALSFAFVLQVGRQGDWCSSIFYALLNKGADHTNK